MLVFVFLIAQQLLDHPPVYDEPLLPEPSKKLGVEKLAGVSILLLEQGLGSHRQDASRPFFSDSLDKVIEECDYRHVHLALFLLLILLLMLLL